jgi:general secretion pathway protein F
LSWFHYRALTAAGASQSGLLESASPEAAAAALRGAGLAPVEIGLARTPTGPAAKPRLLPPRVLAEVFDQLSVLLAAGLTLDRALSVTAASQTKAGPRETLEQAHRSVQEGAPLSRALSATGAFPPMASAMAAAGDAEGRLDGALSVLAETLARAEAMRQALISAMIYPLLLVAVAVGVILTMLLWVVPQFEGLFDEAGSRLPQTTQLLMATSRGLRHDGLLLALGLAAAGFAIDRWRREPSAKRAIDQALLRVPRLGGLLRVLEVGRFARVLGAVTGAGVPLPDAVALASQTLDNQGLAEAGERIAAGLREGRSLSVCVAREPQFPPATLVYLRTGEETGALPPMLTRLADSLERDGRLGLDRLVALVTPLITVAMGGIVAFVIASIMTAIIGFNDLALPT